NHRGYAGVWSGWQLAPLGGMSSEPAAVSWAPGRIDVFASGGNRQIYHASAVETLGGVWACIRQRESSGNYQANTGNGFYGAYQCTPSTWNEAVRGAGYPQYA